MCNTSWTVPPAVLFSSTFGLIYGWNTPNAVRSNDKPSSSVLFILLISWAERVQLVCIGTNLILKKPRKILRLIKGIRQTLNRHRNTFTPVWNESSTLKQHRVWPNGTLWFDVKFIVSSFFYETISLSSSAVCPAMQAAVLTASAGSAVAATHCVCSGTTSAVCPALQAAVLTGRTGSAVAATHCVCSGTQLL